MTCISKGPIALERFQAKYVWDELTDCMVWIATKDTKGYGQFNYEGKGHRAHRISYRLFVGEIPDGLVIDHMCERKACVNPAHLQAVSFSRNLSLRLERRGTFKCGHERSPANSFSTPKHPYLRCRICTNARQQAWRKRKCA